MAILAISSLQYIVRGSSSIHLGSSSIHLGSISDCSSIHLGSSSIHLGSISDCSCIQLGSSSIHLARVSNWLYRRSPARLCFVMWTTGCSNAIASAAKEYDTMQQLHCMIFKCSCHLVHPSVEVAYHARLIAACIQRQNCARLLTSLK